MKIHFNSIKKREYIHYALIFWMIQLIKSNFFTALGIDTMYIMTILIALLVLLIFKKRMHFPGSFALFFILLMICSFFSMIITSGNLTLGTVLNTLGKILFVYCAIRFDSEKFAERFVKLAYVMSICSIACWLVYLVFGQAVVQFICRFLYHAGEKQYGLFLIGYNFTETGISGLRNTYMYAEPGVHQMIPNTALIFALFYGDRISKKNIKYIVVFIINILTIQSTEGYMILLSTLAIAMLQSNRMQNVKFKNVRFLIATIFAVAYVYILNFVNEDNFLYRNFYAKIFNSSNQIDFTTGTAAERFNSIQTFVTFVKSDFFTLLFGRGSLLQNSSYGSISGLIVLLIYFGLVFWLVFYIYTVFLLIKNRRNMLYVIAVLFAVICHGLSQPDFMNVLSLSMLLYGYIYNISNYKRSPQYRRFANENPIIAK